MRVPAFGSQKWRKVDPPGAIRSKAAEWLVPLICLAFGVACLVFVLGPGDGTWVLYAREMAEGHRIYSDLGLNQQPLFPLLSYAGIRLSPGGILGDRLIFFPIVGLHVLLIFLISRRAAGSALLGAALTFATYFTAIHFEAFRYDDYHAVAQCFVLASLYLSVRYAEGELNPDRFAVIQGALAASAFLTRVNEGAAISVAVAMVVLARQGISKATVRSVLMGAAGATAVGASVLLLIGETPFTWFNQTLLVASQAKGGSTIASAPALAILRALQLLLAPISYARDLLIPLSALALVLGCAGFLLWAIRCSADAFRHTTQATRTLSLVSYPFAMFFTGALSTGGEVYGLYFPLALSLLVGTLVLRKPLGAEGRQHLRAALCIFLCMVGIQALVYRAENPFSWHSYHVKPLFVGYRVENNRLHGPHVIAPEVRQLVMPVCERVRAGKTLLSLPISFANYYCGVPVWHGYVQTFFDTSTRSRIEQLERDLEQAPPDFIFYQRQLELLSLHEKIFAGGRRLPHRDLDELIVRKVRGGEWTIAYRSAAYPPSTWYLISTRNVRRVPS
jgi:hypothetical protein